MVRCTMRGGVSRGDPVTIAVRWGARGGVASGVRGGSPTSPHPPPQKKKMGTGGTGISSGRRPCPVPAVPDVYSPVFVATGRYARRPVGRYVPSPPDGAPHHGTPPCGVRATLFSRHVGSTPHVPRLVSAHWGAPSPIPLSHHPITQSVHDAWNPDPLRRVQHKPPTRRVSRHS